MVVRDNGPSKNANPLWPAKQCVAHDIIFIVPVDKTILQHRPETNGGDQNCCNRPGQSGSEAFGRADSFRFTYSFLSNLFVLSHRDRHSRYDSVCLSGTTTRRLSPPGACGLQSDRVTSSSLSGFAPPRPGEASAMPP